MRIYDEIKDLDFKVIIEAGGHMGEDTFKLCDMFPNATIITLEPNPKLYARLKNNKHHNLLVFNDALSDHVGDTEFHIDANPDGLMGASSILPPHPDYLPYLNGEKIIAVKCTTLENFFETFVIIYNSTFYRKINLILDLLWLDIEMMEYRVLKASEQMLKNIRYIYLEISYSNFRLGQGGYDETNNLLVSNGFEQVFNEPQGSPNFDWQSNALYKNTLWEQ